MKLFDKIIYIFSLSLSLFFFLSLFPLLTFALSLCLSFLLTLSHFVPLSFFPPFYLFHCLFLYLFFLLIFYIYLCILLSIYFRSSGRSHKSINPVTRLIDADQNCADSSTSNDNAYGQINPGFQVHYIICITDQNSNHLPSS